MDRSSQHLVADSLKQRLVAAEALDGLHFELIEEVDRLTILRAIRAGAADLVKELTSRPLDGLGESFLDALRTLLVQIDHAVSQGDFDAGLPV